jgi:hypothetical protein
VFRRDLRLRSRSHEGLRETRRGREHDPEVLLRQRNEKSLSRVRRPLRIGTDDGSKNALPYPAEQTSALAEYPTRLAKVPDLTQQRLVNWGYAICDAAMRAHVVPDTTVPAAFPYASAGVG